MEGKMLIFLILSGLCSLNACFDNTYFLVEEAKPWAEALEYCREKYTNLVSIHNMEVLNKLVAIARMYYNGHIWVGLYDDIDSWKWSLEKEGYYSNGNEEFRMWRRGKPDNSGGYENCVQLGNDGLWNAVSCNSHQKFVCYSGTGETVALSNFMFVNEYKTWKDAQRYCRANYADLASVQNQAENDLIMRLTNNQSAWIGLYRDSWKWSDGSPTSVIYWNTDQPTGNISNSCVLLHKGRLSGYQCNTNLFFLCYAAKVKQLVVRVKVTAKDSVNLEDAVEAYYYQQFGRMLKDHGLSGGMKMTWRKQPDGEVFKLKEKEEKKNIICDKN